MSLGNIESGKCEFKTLGDGILLNISCVITSTIAVSFMRLIRSDDWFTSMDTTSQSQCVPETEKSSAFVACWIILEASSTNSVEPDHFQRQLLGLTASG